MAGKRGRPRKNIKDKARNKSVSMPISLIEQLEKTPAKFTSLIELAGLYALKMNAFDQLPEALKGGSLEEIDKLATALSDFSLFENENYRAAKAEQAEIDAEELKVKTKEFTEELVHVAIHNKTQYRYKTGDAVKAVKNCIKRDPSGCASFEDLDYFLSHRPDGRPMVIKDEPPYHHSEEDIKQFIEGMMSYHKPKDPPAMTSIGETF